MSRAWPRPTSDPAGLAALLAELSRIRITPDVAIRGMPLLASSAAGAPSGRPSVQAPRGDGRGSNGKVDGHEPGHNPVASTRTSGMDVDVTDLVRRAQDGDSEAFGRLYDSYLEMVFRYVLYRVGSQAMAEDIVSETFLRALRGISTFTWQGRDIGAWFITIARNLIIDHKKSGHARMEFPTDDILSAAQAQVVSGPEESVLAVFTSRALLDAVRALSPDQQECVVLRFMEGLTVRETALAMGRNEGAIKALQFRATRSLARHIPQGAV